MVEKIVDYQIRSISKEAKCFINIIACSNPQVLALGARRVDAVSVQLTINKKAHEIGFVPEYAYWDVVPMLENAFELGVDLGKRIGPPKDGIFNFGEIAAL